MVTTNRSVRKSVIIYNDVTTYIIFFFQAEDGIRDYKVTGVQTCALPIWWSARESEGRQSAVAAWKKSTWMTFNLPWIDRKSTRLNSSHLVISYAVFCLKKKKKPPTL